MLEHNLPRVASLAYAAIGASPRGEDWPTYGHDAARSQTTAESLPTPLARCGSTGRNFARARVGAASEGNSHPDTPPPAPSGTAFTSTMPSNWRLPAGACTSARRPKTRYTAWMPPRAGSAGRRSPAARSAWRPGGRRPGLLRLRRRLCLLPRCRRRRRRLAFHAAPEDRHVLGHGRMISLWPLRTGVLVDGPVAYFGAGVFPAEGVFLYAADAARDARSGERQRRGIAAKPHLAARIPAGLADHALRAHGPRAPASFDRADGRLLDEPNFGKTVGGAYALLAEPTGLHRHGGDGRLRPAAPGDRFRPFSTAGNWWSPPKRPTWRPAAG